MTGYFVTDDDRRLLWRGRPDDHTPELMAWRTALSKDYVGVSGEVFDAAVAVLAPDDAVVERVAKAIHDADPRATPSYLYHERARRALAAIREEAGR